MCSEVWTQNPTRILGTIGKSFLAWKLTNQDTSIHLLYTWNLMDDNEWLTAYFRMRLHCKRWLQGAWLISSRAGQCQQWTWGQTKAHLLSLLDSDSGTPGCGLFFILHWTETWLSFSIPYQQISTYYNCCGRKKKWRKTSHSSSCWVDRTNSPHLRPRVQPSVPSWLPRHAGWWPSTACRGTHGRCKGQSSHLVRVLNHPSIYGYTVNIRFIQVQVHLLFKSVNVNLIDN